MTFTPAETYEHLLIQARAMHTIISCMEQTRSAGAKHEIAKLKGQLESEREMNAILTAENEEFRARLDLKNMTT